MDDFFKENVDELIAGENFFKYKLSGVLKMTINERFKEVRKSVKLTQEAFGAEIGVTRDVIANIECNRVEPKRINIMSVCRRFYISEDWLLTGEGDMKASSSKESELSQVADQILHETNPLRIELHKLIGSMGDEELKAARLLFDFLMKNTKKK